MNTLLKIGMGLGVVGILILMALAFRAAYLHHMRCLDNGGHWEKVNCHLVQSQFCTTNDWGNGMVTTTCFPTTETECDSVCIGARSEALQ